MVNVSMASQTLGHPRVSDVVELNKAVKMLKETPGEKWRFEPSEMNLHNSIIFVRADSSFACGGHQVAMWLCDWLVLTNN